MTSYVYPKKKHVDGKWDHVCKLKRIVSWKGSSMSRARQGLKSIDGILATLKALALGACCVAAGMGCATRGAFTVQLTADEDSLRSKETGQVASFEVDIVGVNDSEQAKWSVFSVDKYFEVNQQFREDAHPFTVSFSGDDLQPKKLSRRSLHWKTWKKKGAKQIYVIAHLPHMPGETLEDANRRMHIVLPLDGQQWKKHWFSRRKKTLEVRIQRSGLVCETPQR